MKSRKLENLSRAVQSLCDAVALPIQHDRDLGGIIKAFECAYELSWTCLKAHLERQGHPVQGAKDVFRTAWQLGMLPGDDAVWFDMIMHRNLTVHTYNAVFARELSHTITATYTALLGDLATKLTLWHSTDTSDERP